MLVTALTAAPVVALAQAQSEVQLAQAGAQVRSFDIAAGPLPQALVRFTEVTGLQLFVDGNLTRGRQSPGLRGSMTPEAALSRLLDGTGLTWNFTNPTTITLVEAPRGGGATQLPTLTVQGKKPLPETAVIGPAPDAYAGGQVAKGARLGILGNANIMDAPYSVTSYTDKVIADQQAHSLSDVLANDSSVRTVFSKSSGIDQVYVRGFLSANEDVAYNGLFGIASSASNNLAVEGYERVELLKGAAGMLYGVTPGGTTGGVINLVPKRAGDVDITRSTTSLMSDATIGEHIDIGRRFGPDNKFGVRFNALYRAGETEVDSNEQSTQLATLGLDARGDRFRGSLDFGFQNQANDQIVRGIRLGTNVPVPSPPDPSKNIAQPWTYGDNENLFGMGRGEFDINENLTAFGALGFNRLRNEFIAIFPTVTNATTGAMTDTSPFHSTTFTDTVSGELGIRGDYEFGGMTHKPTLSVTQMRQETGTARETSTSLASNLYNPVYYARPGSYTNLPDKPPKTGESALTSGVLADTVGFWDDQLQVTLGGRLQNVTAKAFTAATGAQTTSYNETAITPAVGVVVKPDTTLSVFANYSESLSLGQIAPTSAANANEIFPPFKSDQYEVGVKKDFGNYSLTAAIFQITRPATATNAANVFGVIGEQRNRGVELSVFGEPVKGFRILGGVTYLDGELTRTADGTNNGRTAPGVPEWQVNLGAEYDIPGVNGLTALGRVVHTSMQYFDANNARSIPDWTRFDVGARYVLDTRHPVILRFNIENVLDERYWASAVGTFGTGELNVGAPRTFLLSATVDF